MKVKKYEKKLALNKKTIADLEVKELNGVVGGIPTETNDPVVKTCPCESVVVCQYTEQNTCDTCNQTCLAC